MKKTIKKKSKSISKSKSGGRSLLFWRNKNNTECNTKASCTESDLDRLNELTDQFKTLGGKLLRQKKLLVIAKKEKRSPQMISKLEEKISEFELEVQSVRENHTKLKNMCKGATSGGGSYVSDESCITQEIDELNTKRLSLNSEMEQMTKDFEIFLYGHTVDVTQDDMDALDISLEADSGGGTRSKKKSKKHGGKSKKKSKKHGGKSKKKSKKHGGKSKKKLKKHGGKSRKHSKKGGKSRKHSKSKHKRGGSEPDQKPPNPQPPVQSISSERWVDTLGTNTYEIQEAWYNKLRELYNDVRYGGNDDKRQVIINWMKDGRKFENVDNLSLRELQKRIDNTYNSIFNQRCSSSDEQDCIRLKREYKDKAYELFTYLKEV